MKQSIKQYFQFSRRERNGVFVLLFVLLALVLLRFAMPFWMRIDTNEAQKQFDQNAHALKELNNKIGEGQQVQLQPFNPNTFTLDSLVLCGVSPKLASQIINYRQKVGPFKTKRDFAKLYNLTDSLYSVLAPFILLPEKETESTAPQKIIVEINSADSSLLLTVKGIGPVYAGKILEYRRLLGGYYTLDQLGEAFYINANTLAEKHQRMVEIKAQLKVNPLLIKPLNVNTATQKQLSKHPYISYKESKAIVRLREKAGNIIDANHLVTSGVLTPDKAKLLVKYLSF